MNTLRFLTLALLLTACDGAADPDAGPAAPDAGGATDAGRVADSGADAGVADDAGGADPDAGRSSCGAARPDISSIRGTEGVIIARDGTIYFSQSGGVGRMLPDGTIDPGWLRISGAGTVWGLSLDSANAALFVGVPDNGVFSVDLTTAAPSATRIVDGGRPNGLTMGPDGMLYYSDFSMGRVYRIGAAGGVPAEVTASPIAGANGVAFEAGGTLLVASYFSSSLLRLTLEAGVETGRETLATGLGAPDGIALDAAGRIYVTDNGGGEVLRIDADGTGRTSLATDIPTAAGVEFGAGPLACADLYVASGGALQRITTDSSGAAVLWH